MAWGGLQLETKAVGKVGDVADTQPVSTGARSEGPGAVCGGGEGAGQRWTMCLSPCFDVANDQALVNRRL